MAGLDPAIHDFLAASPKTWMPGTRPGMTKQKSGAEGVRTRCVIFSTSRYCVAAEICFRNSEHVF
jgi:hypothetical protein